MSIAQIMIKLHLSTGLYRISQGTNFTCTNPIEFSALVALYTPYLSSTKVNELNSDYSRRAREVLYQITDRISENLVERQCFLGRNPQDVSPWGLYFAYRICGMLMRPTEKTLHGAEVLKSLREAFQTISGRWNVASVYLELLEAQRAIHLRA